METVHATGRDPLPDANVLMSLKIVQPDAVFFTTIPQLDPEDTDTASEGESEKFPATLLSLYDEQFEKLTGGQLQHACEKEWAQYSCSEMQCEALENSTRSQSVCPRWYEHRKGRITASKAHDMYVHKDATPPENLVKRIMGYNSYSLSCNKAVKWGLDMEDVARTHFKNYMKSKHINFTVELSGLLIDSCHPFLGASVDGISNCDCCGIHTVEIKCPYKHKDAQIKEIAEDPLSCLDGNLNLKATHCYYTQCQVQMHAHKVQYCDFVVYTEKEMCINIVRYDHEFVSKVISKSEVFFMKFVLPELLTRRLESAES